MKLVDYSSSEDEGGKINERGNQGDLNPEQDHDQDATNLFHKGIKGTYVKKKTRGNKKKSNGARNFHQPNNQKDELFSRSSGISNEQIDFAAELFQKAFISSNSQINNEGIQEEKHHADNPHVREEPPMNTPAKLFQQAFVQLPKEQKSNPQVLNPPFSINNLSFQFDQSVNINSKKGNDVDFVANEMKNVSIDSNPSYSWNDLTFQFGANLNFESQKSSQPIANNFGRQRLSASHRDVHGNKSTKPVNQDNPIKPEGISFSFTAPKADVKKKEKEPKIAFQFSKPSSQNKSLHPLPVFSSSIPAYKPTIFVSNKKKIGLGRRRRLATPHKDVHNPFPKSIPFMDKTIKKEEEKPFIFQNHVNPTTSSSFNFTNSSSSFSSFQPNLNTSFIPPPSNEFSFGIGETKSNKPPPSSTDSLNFAFGKIHLDNDKKKKTSSIPTHTFEFKANESSNPNPSPIKNSVFPSPQKMNINLTNEFENINVGFIPSTPTKKKEDSNKNLNKDNNIEISQDFSIGVNKTSTAKKSARKNAKKVLITKEEKDKNPPPPVYKLCNYHSMTTPIALNGKVTVVCSGCNQPFSTIFTDVALCSKCSHGGDICPVKLCNCRLSESSLKCKCNKKDKDEKKMENESNDSDAIPIEKAKPIHRRVVKAVRPKPTQPSNLNENNKSPRMNWNIMKKIADDWYSSRNYLGATEWYTKAINAISDNESINKARLFGNRAAAYLMLNCLKETIRDCIEANTLDPTYTRAYLRCGRAHLLLGNLSEACAQFTKVIELDKNQSDQTIEAKSGIKDATSVDVARDEMKWCVDFGQYGEAIQHANIALRISKRSKSFLCEKIKIMMKNGQNHKAIKCCEEYLGEIKQNDSRVVVELGKELALIYAKLLNYENMEKEAMSLLHRLELAAPNDSNVLKLSRIWSDMKRYKQLGNDAYLRGDYQLARQLYTTALGLDSDHLRYNSVIYCNRAAVLMSCKKYQEAINDCNEALARDATYSKARLRRARAYVCLHQYDQGIRDYNLYLDECPNDESARAERDEAVSNKHQKSHSKKKESSNSRNGKNRYAWDDTYSSHHGNDNNEKYYSWKGSNKKNNASYADNRYSSNRNNNRRTPPNKTKTTERNHYDILGIPKSATMVEIKKAYRKLALQHHPDKAKDTKYADLFKDMTAAYNVLSDPDQKVKYDRELRSRGFGVYYEY